MNKEDLNQLATLNDLETLRKGIVDDLKKIFDAKLSPQKQFLSPKEFSYHTGIPYSTIVNRCKTGKLKARQDDPKCSWQIYASELERYKSEADENAD